ncbi:MAG: 30S ribosomal protein S3 [Planctomycetes bacterium DG_58]|nr:MAG: 30S ribosomal protein S3 [Planctomycetes bacterium DG_58]
MGQKVRPTGLRLGIVENWRSRGYADKKNFGRFLVEDQKIRKFIRDNYAYAAIASVEIERTAGQTTIILHTARPGIIIGRKGQEVDRLKMRIEDIAAEPVNIKIQEVATPELSAQLVADSIREQLQKRSSFRRTMKRVIEQVMEGGAQGVKVRLAGRIGGSDMARREVQSAGKIPLQTLRAKIDYGFTEAATTYGNIGIKVWIYTGEVLEEKEEVKHAADAETGEVSESAAGKS